MKLEKREQKAERQTDKQRSDWIEITSHLIVEVKIENEKNNNNKNPHN